MPNAWVEHTRAFAKKNGISYGCAISDPKNKESYHANKGGKGDVARQKKESSGMGAEDVDAPSDGVSSRIIKLMQDKNLLQVAENFLDSSLSRKDTKNRKIGVAFKEDYLDKPRAERIKMITPFLERQAERKEEDLQKIEDWKKKQKTLLTKVKTINVEPLEDLMRVSNWEFKDINAKSEFSKGTMKREIRTKKVYGKIGGKWYIIGIERQDSGERRVEMLETFFYVPNYIFVKDGVNITKKTRGIRDYTGNRELSRAFDRLKEMGVDMEKKPKKP